jgi:hypothetical protein
LHCRCSCRSSPCVLWLLPLSGSRRRSIRIPYAHHQARPLLLADHLLSPCPRCPHAYQVVQVPSVCRMEGATVRLIGPRLLPRRDPQTLAPSTVSLSANALTRWTKKTRGDFSPRMRTVPPSHSQNWVACQEWADCPWFHPPIVSLSVRIRRVTSTRTVAPSTLT